MLHLGFCLTPDVHFSIFANKSVNYINNSQFDERPPPQISSTEYNSHKPPT